MFRLCTFFALLSLLGLGCEQQLLYVPRGGVGDDGGPRVLIDGGVLPGPDGGPGVTPPGSTDMCGDVRTSNAVNFGTDNPTYLEMSPGQILSVVMLDMGGSLCSGLVIAPKWVLTAAHCASGRVTVRLGANNAMPDHEIEGLGFDNHPSADISIIELAEDATTVVPGLVPVRVLTEEIDNSWVGHDTEAGGYGRTESGSIGTRYFSHLPIADISNDTIGIDGRGQGGVCNGDSGGPIMARSASGQVRTIGVVSNGDGTCTYRANFTRADNVRDWIEEHTGPTPEDDGLGCGTTTPAGKCEGAQAIWCEGTTLRSQECAAGTICGFDTTANGYRCVPEAQDPCRGIDARGVCEGGVARWCDRGALRARDCGACQQSCVVADDLGGAYCRADACAGVSYAGRCDGSVAVWCEAGRLLSKDCGALGQSCGFVNEQLGNYCR